MQISDYFIKGDVKGAINYMKQHEEFKDVLSSYIALFEKCEYRNYDVPSIINDILRQYQIYYRDIFYLKISEEKAASNLFDNLKRLLDTSSDDEEFLTNHLKKIFTDNGYHVVFGKTQGYYGPYVWKETVPTVYNVELPEGIAKYQINILKGFVFRSWMDYLTFGRFGTGGWAEEDGTINCIEQAYDFESERFLVSFLKHEAQHTIDMKKYKGITPTELEYRAKLVELHYSSDINLFQKFICEANENNINNSHAIASTMIKNNFIDVDKSNINFIQSKALFLLIEHTKEMERKYK